MNLTPYDDFPFHQHATPLNIPETSDPHFNDGYWFGWWQGEQYFFCGLRLHPNNNVMDGYAGVVHHGEQRSMRFSRALRPAYDDLGVGPFRLHILEPLRTQRLTLAPNDTGVSWNVTVTKAMEPFFEAPHRQYRFGRLFNNLCRFSLPTRVSGWAEIDGERTQLDGWYGARDHSWGIRSTMGPHVPIGGIGEEATDFDRRAIRIWIPFEVGDHAGFFHTHEHADGEALDFEGRLEFRDGRVIPLAGVRHDFSYHPGTRRLSHGAYTLIDVTGEERKYEFRVVGHPAHPQGFGYARGWSDSGQPGVYRGPEKIEWERFDVSDPAVLAGPPHVPVERRLGGTEFAADLVGPDGSDGMAHVEHMIYGTYRPYGFEGKG